MFQAIQNEIESHSQLVTAVLKLCERLDSNPEPSAASNDSSSSLTLVARSLERRWHTVWLSSLEWQCRLEEALGGSKVSFGCRGCSYSVVVVVQSLTF